MSELILAHAPEAAGGSVWPSIGTVVALCVFAAVYGAGVQELWSRRGRGAVIGARHVLCFTAGLVVLALTFSPPATHLAEASFTGHMTQHMAILVVAAPLLALGGAGLAITMALPHPVRRWQARIRAGSLVRWSRKPMHRSLIGGLLFTGVLWAWHLPALYVLAEENEVVHAVEHLSYLGAAWLLWAAVLTPERHRLNGPLAFLLLFGVGMAGAALGAVLTLAPAPLYPAEVFATATRSALADQQLAGLIMWIPMDVVVMGVALSIFSRWLTDLRTRFPGETLAPATQMAVETAVAS